MTFSAKEGGSARRQSEILKASMVGEGEEMKSRLLMMQARGSY